MRIVYYSLVGNVRRFLAKTGLPAQPIGDYDVDEPFVIVTNTLGFGEVPEPVARFLVRNGRNLVGVASSGNRNWGENFGKAADIIAKEYDVPILLKFELSGTDDDVRIFTERMREIDETYRTE
ncbi:class Ib ribonucleoside-diphosphate reductase assembly flavoprotein NrdI [Paenibacillus alvei]|uniref:Protein NrdI n=1 Tax=Paenibacillus alvei TaxID=44250 RepID=A0ABT4GUK7_PAEAL|nr:class Ib ribonucleoside-diphosphate reductase assembly flavoprotein NrdI [Paenibacillus alvei]MCY9760387.1 class Ib ribonucleoside-diphosphate reductase assembly flavoprotein NrdI [Paenibacillus alvei]MCY9767679.1 class Ib ribonucleoside-diphosphate reductase assembly flavoprotein NrdI [Paenibacillus alvei]